LWLRLATNRGVMVSIAAFNALLILVSWAFVLHVVNTDRQETIRVAVARQDNLAIAFEQYVLRTIDGADAAISYLIREYESRDTSSDLAVFVQQHKIENPALIGIVFADANGDAITTTSGGDSVIRLNVADREHFMVHTATNGGGLFIGKPVTGRIIDREVIPVSKRINKSDGSFGGVVVALIEPGRLVDMMRDTRLSSLDVLSVIGPDGITRARLRGSTASAGEDIRSSPLFALQAKRPVGNYFAPGALDGVARFYSYRTLPAYNVIVTLGAAESAVLAEFAQRRLRYFLAAGLVTVLIAAFTLLLMFALTEQRRSATLVARGQARFLATFNQAAVGMAHCGLDGSFIDVNQKFCDMLGYSMPQMLHMSVADITHADDLARTNRVLRSLRESPAAAAEVWEKRYVHKDGHTVWGLLNVSLVRDHTGQPSYYSAVTQDISERKKTEQALNDYALRLQTTSRQLLTVQEDERRVLARELHDTVGQELTAMSLNLSLIRSGLPVEVEHKLGSHLDDSQKLLEDTTQHLRDVMVELRPAGLDELGLIAALVEHARRVARRSGVQLDVRGSEPDPRFAPATEIALFRIAQEALNNIIKHARASSIVIELIELAHVYRLIVQDNGVGFDTTRKPLISAHGMGLTTMRERAEAIGGRCTIESTPGLGTTISVEVQRSSLAAPDDVPH